MVRVLLGAPTTSAARSNNLVGTCLLFAFLSVQLMSGGTSSCGNSSSGGAAGCSAVDQSFNNITSIGLPPSITFSGSTAGLNGASDTLSATATFILAGQTDAYGNACIGGVGTLCVTLVNTQTGGTQSRSDLLDSLYFSVTGNPTLTPASALANQVLNPNSTNTAILSVAPQSPVLNGGWALVTSPGTDTVNTKLPTSGFAWTTVGNNGGFSNGTYNQGSDNYGIIAPGTNVVGGLANIPTIQTDVFLTLNGFQTANVTDSLGLINGVFFTWNSTGVYSANGTVTDSTIPEPSTFLLFGVALTGIGLLKPRRRR
jgi:hypothetical protein